ncbi:hypothetical protein ES703_101900 [subsurface metagenome]
MTMIHLGLSSGGNRFATEIACFVGMIVFYGTEIVLGITSLELTLSMLLIVTPVMVIEALRPSNKRKGNWPQVVKIEGGADRLAKEVLCFAHGDGYVALAAIRIKGIPLQNERRTDKHEENEDFKWLYPLWEDSKKSKVTYTLEAKFEKGLADSKDN